MGHDKVGVTPLLGVDIVPVERIARLIARQDGALDQILAPSERGRPHTAESIAGRFAMKEAVGKLLGTGFAHGVQPSDIALCKDQLGKPHVQLTGAAEARASTLGISHISVSISHSAGLALCIAAAIVLRHAEV